jgi:hypothetical protein
MIIEGMETVSDAEVSMIHRVRIQNFKSIIDVTVDLSPVTVLVGRSGTGKSNFVHSLRWLRDILTSPHQANAFQQQWPLLRPALSPNSAPRFEVEFSIAGLQEKFAYEISFAPEGPQAPIVSERLNIGDKCLFHQSQASPQTRALKWVVKPELLEAPAAGQISLGRIPSISEVVIAFTALTSGIGCYAFSDDVLSGKPRTGLPAATTGLDDGATNFLVTLKEIVSNLQDLKIRKSIVGALQRVNPTVSSVELNDLLQPSSVVVGHKFNGKTLPLGLSQESDGFRRFYAHLLALYQRPPKQTLIFEHPEDGIHPGALSMLAEEFKAAPLDSRGQVILTTHSPKFLDYFDADQIRVVELDGFATRIGPVSREQKEAIREKYLDAGELLTVDPARIEQEAAAS